MPLGDPPFPDFHRQSPYAPPLLPPAEPEPQPVDHTPDLSRLDAAHGDPQVWSEELMAFLASVSGQHFDPSTLVEWLRVYAGQVQQLTMRSAMFQVANTELPAHVHGDASLLMWQLRDTIAAGFRTQAGVE